jgi:hypothetical protein
LVPPLFAYFAFFVVLIALSPFAVALSQTQSNLPPQKFRHSPFPIRCLFFLGSSPFSCISRISWFLPPFPLCGLHAFWLDLSPASCHTSPLT